MCSLQQAAQGKTKKNKECVFERLIHLHFQLQSQFYSSSKQMTEVNISMHFY